MSHLGLGANEVICALATPPGRSSIGVIRVSGPGALVIVKKLAPFLPEKPESHKCYLGILKDPKSQVPIDEVLITYFAQGKSYTGQEVFEISCHGNPVVLNEVIQKLILSGVRLARPGEFTYRAFMNGKVDLVEAEAVHSLIVAQGAQGARTALRQLSGELSQGLTAIRKDLYGILSQMEASIDFSEQGLEFWTPEQMRDQVSAIAGRVATLLKSYTLGKRYSEGLKVVLIGEPNVGKSSLLNALIGDSVAIVDETPGTTRDTVTASVELDGVALNFVDTAGLRETSDRVEKIGIEKARQALKTADLVLAVWDASRPTTKTYIQSLLVEISGSSVLILANKEDLVGQSPGSKEPDLSVYPNLSVSALRSKELRDKVFGFIRSQLLHLERTEGPMVSAARHFEGLSSAQSLVQSSLAGLERGDGYELVAGDLQIAAARIDEILGIRVDEAVIDRIFKDFCLGK